MRASQKNVEIFRSADAGEGLGLLQHLGCAQRAVLQKLVRTKEIRMYEEDQDLLEDVIIENKQAIEMAEIYSNILSGMMDAFASVISNNLNIVMKLLTSITIIIAVPTLVASLFGMNVHLPFERSPIAFVLIVLLSVGLAALAAGIFWRKRYL